MLRKLAVCILLFAQLLALKPADEAKATSAPLQVTGFTEAIVLRPAERKKISVQVFNNTQQRTEITAGYFLDKGPDNAGVVFQLSSENFILGAQRSHDYFWQVQVADNAEFGEYLFWLEFSADIHTQNTEAGDFIVQNTAYFPVRLVVGNIVENSDD